MRNLALYLLVLTIKICHSASLDAQDSFPEFEISSVEITMPKDVLGYSPSLEEQTEGHEIYRITGQRFENPGSGHLMTSAEGFSGTTNRSTPWKVLTELLAAYHAGDWQGVERLYTADSQPEIREIFSSPQMRKEMMAIPGMNVLLGYEYEGGFLAHASIPNASIYPFFLVKRSDRYYLSTLEITGSLPWNLGVFLSANPLPHLRPVVIRAIESIKHAETQTLVFGVHRDSDFVVLFQETEILRMVQDGHDMDLDKRQGVVAVEIPGESFEVGSAKVDAVETNYPVWMISKEARDKAARISFEVSPRD